MATLTLKSSIFSPLYSPSLLPPTYPDLTKRFLPWDIFLPWVDSDLPKASTGFFLFFFLMVEMKKLYHT